MRVSLKNKRQNQKEEEEEEDKEEKEEEMEKLRLQNKKVRHISNRGTQHLCNSCRKLCECR